ncbi:PEP/pyruvate-binding domain-containing protein [Dethiosulfovibrio salsuginis]|uniref:Pyruvate phosphate dikinase, PEP/pyruvate binding domain n=1 Tax=Dethiosulfovibrio salsuginis TaxID=561720 RepID=A0A1X7K0Q3_9BACT|nr:PEP/pyruvate-binding domain-containing protein [Dethiosulfovibrio salsuginis]SMG34051.1 Pyruvate phosphate dikinase, PEP/pyruvate binding domain [Dethiosulfovibrio salsuginis]
MDHREAYRYYDPLPYFQERGWLIGGGAVGGKGKGLAFAHDVLKQDGLSDDIGLPEMTFVVGTDVFDLFDKEHGIMDLSSSLGFEGMMKEALTKPLPDSVMAELERVVASVPGPLAVRSSSLLEDDIELSFAGKYATFFVANVGDQAKKLADLADGVKKVFASTYNSAAKEYRKKHSIPKGREKMAVLIQPLQGKRRGDLFYPEMAVTAFSCVYRRPSPRIDKNDGVMRVCFGMGTHSVGRSFARTLYLTNPGLRPEGTNPEQVYLYSQKEFDCLDLSTGELVTKNLWSSLDHVRSHHRNASSFIEWYGDGMLYWLNSDTSGLTSAMPCFSFSDLPKRCKSFLDKTKRMLSFFQGAMGFPVDMEAVYDSEEDRLTLVQIRPLASYVEFGKVDIPKDVPLERQILKGNRMVTSHVLKGIKWLVYVDPDHYSQSRDFVSVARAVGEVNGKLEGERYILVGPGRWGSTNPSLGVPVDYSEISNCGCMVEVGIPKRGMIPELSYGTHFFLDLDLDDILYLPVIEGEHENIFSREWLERHPSSDGGHGAVRVYEGLFDVYLDGETETGVVLDVAHLEC